MLAKIGGVCVESGHRKILRLHDQHAENAGREAGFPAQGPFVNAYCPIILEARGANILQQPVVALINRSLRKTCGQQLPIIIKLETRHSMQDAIRLHGIQMDV